MNAMQMTRAQFEALSPEDQTTAFRQVVGVATATLQQTVDAFEQCVGMVLRSPSSAIMTGFRHGQLLSDAEINEYLEAADLSDRAEAGWFVLEPIQASDREYQLTNEELGNYYGVEA